MSTAIWTIAGFLSTVSIILYATAQGSSELVSIGPETLLLGLSAALIGGMTSFPQAVARRDRHRPALPGARVQLPERDRARAVRAVHHRARARRAHEPRRRRRRRELLVRAAGPAGPRTAARDLVGPAHAAARSPASRCSSRSCCRSSCTQSAHQLTYSIILAFAICAVSVTVLTGWGGQLSLGQMAFAGIGALSGAAFSRGVTINIGWRSTPHLQRRAPTVPVRDGARARRHGDPDRDHGVATTAGDGRQLALAIVGDRRRARAADRCSSGTSIGPTRAAAAVRAQHLPRRARRVPPRGAGRHRRAAGEGPAARDQHDGVRDRGRELHLRPADLHRAAKARSRCNFPRGKLGPIDLEPPQPQLLLLRARDASWSCSSSSGHLRRTGIGRTIIGVRENEPAAAALTVSPTRAKLTAFALGGFIAGLGGALLGGLVVTIGYSERFFTRRRLAQPRRDRGDRRARQPRGRGHRRAVGHRPARVLARTTRRCSLFTSSIGLLIVLLYIPGGFTQIGYSLRGAILNWLEKRLPERATKTRDRAARVAHPRRDTGRPLVAQRRRQRARDARASPSASAASSRSTRSTSTPSPARSSGSSARTAPGSRRCSTRSAASCRADGTVELLGRDVTELPGAPAGARRPRAHVPGRDALPRADGARDGAARARSPRRHVVLGIAAVAARPRRAPSGRSGPRPPS